MTATGADVRTNLRPLGIGEVLDAAIKLYRNHFKTLVLAVAVPMVVLSIAQTLVGTSVDEDAFTANPDGTIDQPGGSFWAALLVLFVLGIIGLAATFAACCHAAIRGYLGEETTWKESVVFGLKRALPLVVLFVVAYISLSFMYLLLIIPGIWLSVRWMVSIPAMMAEGIGPFAGLGRSFRLVKGRWWATFAVQIGLTILLFIVLILSYAILGIAFADPDSLILNLVVSTVFTVVAYGLAMPIAATVVTVLYYDLRVRKEGYDMQMALGGDQPAAPQTWGPAETGQPAAPVSWGAPDTSSSAPPPPPGGGFSTPSPGGFAPPTGPRESLPGEPAPEERPPAGSPPGAA